MHGYVPLETLGDLRARIRKEDLDIREAFKRLGTMEHKELSNMIREGVRHELRVRGALLPYSREGGA